MIQKVELDSCYKISESRLHLRSFYPIGYNLLPRNNVKHRCLYWMRVQLRDAVENYISRLPPTP